jgi:hypothetical protein
MTTITTPVGLIAPQHPPNTTDHDERTRQVQTALQTEHRERHLQRSALLMLPPR